MSFRLAVAAAAGAMMIVPGVACAQVLMQRDVSLRMALTIAEAALAECGTTTSVAIVDRAGRLRVFLQGDNANPHNIELARRKAYTARTFRAPSAEWAKRTETANSGQRMLAEVIPLGGGMP
ncbi:MAG TPA: heme-binding protein, partial [Xanthobacteraceae bacterium]|nr:heme-binding protein [Xanthobacteraceae bacterium]